LQSPDRSRAGKESGVRLRWDESKVVSIHPTVAQVKASRQEVMLLLGTRMHSDDIEVHASLDERVVMSPFVAKRLLALLNNVLEQYESLYGSLSGQSLPVAKREKTHLLGLPPFRSRLTVEKVTSFFEHIRELKLLIGLERSFKISQKVLMGGRFLVAIKKNQVSQNSEETMLLLCEKMGMPPNLLSGFSENLSRASVIGFGFGENEKDCIAKAYLEFDHRRNGRSEPKGNDLQPYLSHLGFKWDVNDNSRNLVARYNCFPLLSMAEIQRRMQSCISACSPEMYGIIKDIIELASYRVASDKFIYVEVNEEGSLRSSFDLNIYQADLLMEEVYPFFQKMCGQYSISFNEFDALYNPVKDKIFGHLAGGVGKNGKDFLTVYFSD